MTGDPVKFREEAISASFLKNCNSKTAFAGPILVSTYKCISVPLLRETSFWRLLHKSTTGQNADHMCLTSTDTSIMEPLHLSLREYLRVSGKLVRARGPGHVFWNSVFHIWQGAEHMNDYINQTWTELESTGKVVSALNCFVKTLHPSV